MECFLQYLDDLDDLYGMIGLIRERVRRACVRTLLALALLIAAFMGMALPQLHPPLALATLALLVSTLLYRSATASKLAAH